MKNIGAGVSEVLTAEKKEVEKKTAEEEKECIRKKNEMIFCLRKYPDYQISGVAEWWSEYTYGGSILMADTYFRHSLTGRRCETPWACIVGVAGVNEYHEERWETLCMRIVNHENIVEDMCYRKRVEL